MSFNRLKYDLSVQNLDDKSAQKLGIYSYNTPIIKKNCYQTNARIINQKVGVVCIEMLNGDFMQVQ